MSQLSRGIFGALAVSATLGAVQLASGRDLGGARQDLAGATEPAVNRAAKADRAAAPAGSVLRTRTISLRLDSLSDTSILVRVPVAIETAKEARDGGSVPAPIRSGDLRMALACEPVVSVLTEVARQLQPGRCIT